MQEAIETDIYRQKATLSEEETNMLAAALEKEMADEVHHDSSAIARDAIVLVRRAISEARKMNMTAFEIAGGEALHEAWKKRRLIEGAAETKGIQNKMVPFSSLQSNERERYFRLIRQAIRLAENRIREVPWHGDAFKASMDEFLKSWEGREGYLGAMLVGSYGSGLQDGYSDVDMYVILSPDTKWRERGDNRYGDFLVEYNAHPIPYIQELIEQDKRLGKRHCCRKVSTGIILSDPTGQIRALQDEAKKRMIEPLPKFRDPEWIEMSKYYMWDQIDNLRDLAERNDPGFSYAYFAGVVSVVDYYSKFLGAEVPRPVRAYQFFSSEDFCRSYNIDPFPDKEFSTLVLDCMVGADISRVDRLTAYVTEKMGGLEIDGWVLRQGE